MLFLVCSPLFSLSSACPPRASEKTLGLGKCFSCILQRELILSGGMVIFIPPIQTAHSNDPNRALKHSSWCWWFACHHHHSAPKLLNPTFAIESDYWEFVDCLISLWWLSFFCDTIITWIVYAHVIVWFFMPLRYTGFLLVLKIIVVVRNLKLLGWWHQIWGFGQTSKSLANLP